jgi:hypothetical protein
VNTELAIYFGSSNVGTSVDTVACPATHGEHFWARQLFMPGRVFVALVLAFAANLSSLAQSPAVGSSGPGKDPGNAVIGNPATRRDSLIPNGDKPDWADG